MPVVQVPHNNAPTKSQSGISIKTSEPKLPQGTPQSESNKQPAPVMGEIGKLPSMPSMAGNIPRLDEAIPSTGKYEVTEESDFTIYLHLKKYSGRWLLMNRADETTDEHSVTFRMWTYNEMIEMKKMATSYDLRKKMHEVDNDLLNRIKIQRLLKSWTFGNENKNLVIQHVGGKMTDEGWVAFTKLQPNIAQYIITEMNYVLEYNR